MKINIQYKLTLINTAIIAIILGGIYLYLNSNLTEHTYQRIRQNLSKQTKLAKSYLDNNLSVIIDIDEVDQLVDQIGKDLKLRVTVINLEGKVLGDSELDGEALNQVENHLYRPEIQKALTAGLGESRRFSTTTKKDLLYMAQPFGEKATKGFVRLAIPLSEIQLVSDNLKKLLGVSLAVAFFLAVILSSIVSTFISRPIRDMSMVAQSIAEGNFSRRILLTTNDEIEELGKAINYMSEQIKMRMEEVVANKSRFEAILLSMFEGVMVIDGQGIILLMNQTLKTLFNIGHDPVNQRVLEVIRNIEIQEIVDKVLELKKGVESTEISVLLPEERIFHVHATPVLRNDRADGAVLVFHDITELRRLESVRQDFVANVSHEIRTPVTNIKGYAETLIDGALNDKKNAKDFLEIISADSDRLSQLVDDLLDLSRIESGKLNLDIKAHDLELIVDRVMMGLKKQASDRRVTINKDFPPNMPKAMIDDTSIAQVLLNLIENGVKYNKINGSVTISASQKNDLIEVKISDTGIGIPEEDLPRIFERFYRVDKARSRQLGGTGLGLSIAKHIIQSYKQNLSVESRLEEGSTFTFTLPKA